MNERMLLLPAIIAGAVTFAPAQPADVTVELLAQSESSWYVGSQTPSDAGVVDETGPGNPNPDLTLSVGTRYTFTNVEPVFHPFAIFASGPPNDFLLRQGGGVGSFESDPEVNWENDPVTDMTFTLTPALADALLAGGRTPSYTCEAHPVMVGQIVFQAQPSPFTWPTGTETFENAPLGASVADAFEGWTLVGGSEDYTATIEEEPASDPGQETASTRWLTVVDDDPGGENRLYPPAVSATETVASYTFTWRMNVQSVGGNPFLLVSQHMAPAFSNLGGLEVSDTGVDVILLGTDDGGIGKSGATERVPLYSYADTGGFGMDNWVTVSFTVDVTNGELTGEATGSDGATTTDATISGLDLQNGADPGEFRWCMRNNTTGSVSVVSYDHLSLTGTGAPPASVEGWLTY